MKPTRTYGTIYYHQQDTGYSPGRKKDDVFGTLKPARFEIIGAEAHVCIRLKANFARLNDGQTDNFEFADTPENCHDLLWFIERYPLAIDGAGTMKKMRAGRKAYLHTQRNLEQILSDEYKPRQITLNEGEEARDYQLRGAEVMYANKKMLLLDELGLGKSLTATLCLLKSKTLPALIVVQSHMTTQWEVETLQRFTNLKAYIISGFKTYKLPVADVYIINYHCLSKWVDILSRIVRSVVFDECQELRKGFAWNGEVSAKYLAAYNLCDVVNYAWGLSASPIYNYGDEIFNIIDCIRRGSLGRKYEFTQQWCKGPSYEVKEPIALGTYLREKFLRLRRTAKDVDRELPEINTIIYPVEYDEEEVASARNLAKQLAISYLTSSSFAEKGSAAMEFDNRLRQLTGVAKAHYVSALVRILLENNEPVLLSGWHRDVYEIWLNDLKEYNPFLYTGSEGAGKKDKAKKAFMSGETNLLIISNRSGIGLDGLQHRCKNIIIGELDWSPKVHDQIVGRVNRDGQRNQVTVYYPICEFGSDPGIVTVLGIKSQQSHNIVDPGLPIPEQHTDQRRIRVMAETFLKNSGVDVAKLKLVIDKDGNLDIEEKNNAA